MMREAVPGYDQVEDETVAATGAGAKSVLELGIGTGETARRVLARHPEAKLIGIDGSPGMVAVARDTLPAHRVTVLVGDLEDPLPEGPFDLVVSALAVHHLHADSKADLFRRIANALEPGGRFVLADVVTPLNPSYVVTAIDPEVDYPSTLDEQLAWLDAAGISPEVTWTHRDLVVIVGTARSRRLPLVLERSSNLPHHQSSDGERSRNSEVLPAPKQRFALGVGRGEHLVVVRLADSRSAAFTCDPPRRMWAGDGARLQPPAPADSSYGQRSSDAGSSRSCGRWFPWIYRTLWSGQVHRAAQLLDLPVEHLRDQCDRMPSHRHCDRRSG